MFDLFISHSSLDKEKVARPLYRNLTKKKLNVWLDEVSINYGDSISQSVFSGLKKSRCLVVIISKNSLSSNWTWIESGFYIAQDKNCVFVPLLYDITHSELAEKFPFIADKKYILLNDDNDIQKICTELYSIIEKQKSLDVFSKTFIDIKELLKKLKCSTLQQNYELISFIQEYLNFYGNEILSYFWIEKSLEKIIHNVSTYESISSEISIFIEDCKQINRTIKEYFILFNNIKQIFLSTASISKHQLSILDNAFYFILDWYIINYVQIDYENKENDFKLEAVPTNSLSKNDIIETYNIEKLVLRDDLIADWSEAFKWYQHNPYTFIGVRDKKNGKIIGFCTIIPVSDEWFEKFKSGEIDDTTINLSDIRKYDIPDFYNIYISSVCIHPDYQGLSGAFTILYNKIIDMFLKLAQNNEIYIYKLLAEASTIDGERLCKLISMKKIGETNHNTNIYESYLIPPSLRLKSKSGKMLLNYYQKKYNELKELL